jgi:type II secretory pathway component PulF
MQQPFTQCGQQGMVQTVIQVGIHMFLWLVLLAIIVFWVPQFQGPLADFKSKVPWPTDVILAVSEWFVEFWFFLAPAIIILLLVIDGPVYLFLRRHHPNKSWLWSGLMILLPLALLSIVFVALLLPGVKALERTSR